MPRKGSLGVRRLFVVPACTGDNRFLHLRRSRFPPSCFFILTPFCGQISAAEPSSSCSALSVEQPPSSIGGSALRRLSHNTYVKTSGYDGLPLDDISCPLTTTLDLSRDRASHDADAIRHYRKVVERASERGCAQLVN